MNANQGHLFQFENKARYGENRVHQSLFIPRLLRDRALDKRLTGDAQDKAYEIICKWAKLESSGKLEKKKETALEGEFLTEVFGAALGYTLFSDNKERWHIEPKYTVDGGIADAAIGLFKHGSKVAPIAVIELKGPSANLDRDRFRGRTAWQQCWDYLYNMPQCPWGIVCNYVSFRIYHRNFTPRSYQLFTLQDLVRKDVFKQFWYIFHRDGLLPSIAGKPSRNEQLLEESHRRQREVGDILYDYYHDRRVALISHLTSSPHKKDLNNAIRIVQKLIDRIMFIAFCEDRELLPKECIKEAHTKAAPFERVINPKWRNFLSLFKSIDQGNPNRDIEPYNGGLFKEDDEVDNLQLDDKWTEFFNNIGKYDFRDEVSVEVLGHLFEKSLNDIERIQITGLFGEQLMEEVAPKMKKSAERKRSGIYYTPPEFTSFIVNKTVGDLIDSRFRKISNEMGLSESDTIGSEQDTKLGEYWRKCFDTLRDLKIVDPACGSGAFLIKAYDLLDEKYNDVIDNLLFHEGEDEEKLKDQIPGFILNDNLFGVDLSQEAVEITQLALWIRSARKGKTLADLSRNIVLGNSLVTDPEVHPHAMEWGEKFPEVFNRENSGFDCVIGNPPWERMKLQEREFFDAAMPEIGSAVSAATRRKLIKSLKENNPELYQRYLDAKSSAESVLTNVRSSGYFPLTAKGDINTYAVFAELAHNIVSPNGLVGLLVPSGIATDHTARNLFVKLVDTRVLRGLYDFENKAGIFPDVHRSYKFCVFLFGGADVKSDMMDFVFFARAAQELDDAKRHITLSVDDLKLLNPNTKTCPVFRSQRDAEITKSIYSRVPILVDKNREEGGNPWGIKFFRMFDQTNDAELFHSAEQLKGMGFKRSGANWKKGKKEFIPLYEAKMIQMYDHRAASVVVKDVNWMRQGQTAPTNLVQHQNPEYSVEPRWWVEYDRVCESIGDKQDAGFISFKDVTSPTNVRTMIAAFLPFNGVLNSAPLIPNHGKTSERKQCCLLANLNSFVLDYVARQKVGGVHLNFFIVEQLPILAPDFYDNRCPWDKRQTLEKWVSDRVLKLTCTANDMIPLAEAAGFDPPVHKWDPEERADLIAQLDAAYFILYGIARDDVEYILSTFSGINKEDAGSFDSSNTASRILFYYEKFIE